MDIINNALGMGEEIVKFLVFGVGLGYIGRKLVADYVIKKGRVMIAKSERNGAIWQHYQRQAKGLGHESASPIGCSEEKCRVFGSVPQIV